ncbi:MAG TPA: TIGR02444 family protein [Ramlibacter sp.]|nr:TIGR02444 family protein [Ramlibacter sp.]
MSQGPRTSLWDFAVWLYSQPGVAATSLDLQERHRVDVNLLMFAAWVGGALGARLTAADVVRAQEVSAIWQQQWVVPIRALRRQLKAAPTKSADPGFADILESMKALELQAERLEIEQLQSVAAQIMRQGSDPAGASPVTDNLLAIMRAQAVPDAAATAAAEVIRQAGGSSG